MKRWQGDASDEWHGSIKFQEIKPSRESKAQGWKDGGLALRCLQTGKERSYSRKLAKCPATNRVKGKPPVKRHDCEASAEKDTAKGAYLTKVVLVYTKKHQ
eukprot:scaffold213884_cov17-Tisochrysis_lutea.AAC.1